jgi:hypothetical protein
MTAFTKLLTVLILGTALVSLGAQDPQKAKNEKEQGIITAMQKMKAESSDLRSQLLTTIVINGEELSPLDLKRETVFLAGTNLIELKILEFIVEEWKERLIKEEGKTAADFEVDNSAIEAELKTHLQEFTFKYPGLDFWEVVRSQTGIPKDQYIHQRRVTMQFDKVFMPGPADKWPAITKEAVKAGANGTDGDAFLKGLEKNSYDDDGKPREMPKFWAEMIRKMLVGQLKKWSDIKYPVDGLPSSVVLDVNGRRWDTAEAFEQVKQGLFVQDMERAISELVIREALKQELVAKGSYLSDEEFRKEFKAYRKQFDDTLFNTEMIARAFKGYPTLEAFRARWRLIKSYENMIAKDVNDDVLQKHADKHKRFFADGSVSVDVIPFMGKSHKSGAWQPNGMNKARERAARCVARIKSGEKTFDQALDAWGEYYPLDKEKGRLGNKSLNELRRSIRESEYSEVLTGFSLGYFLYYDAKPGEVIGPVMGTDAWYIVRVNAQGPARQEVSVKEERTRDLVKQDFLTHKFLQWSKEVVAKAEIK